jgi:hypothetical protein
VNHFKNSVNFGYSRSGHTAKGIGELVFGNGSDNLLQDRLGAVLGRPEAS